MLAGGDEETYFKVFDAGDVPSGWTFTVSGNVTEEDESIVVQEADDDDPPFYRTTEVAISLGVHFPKQEIPEMVHRLRETAAAALR